jgi:hypothetical protein
MLREREWDFVKENFKKLAIIMGILNFKAKVTAGNDAN